MSDSSQKDERQKEAPAGRRSRWDRSSREEGRSRHTGNGPGEKNSQHSPPEALQRASFTSQNHNPQHTSGNDGLGDGASGAPSRHQSGWQDQREDRRQRRRFTEQDSADPEELRPRGDHHAADSLDNLRDAELEEGYRQYKQELVTHPTSDTEAQKRDYAAAFSSFDTDVAPVVPSEEPQFKKTGFTMTMGRSEAVGAPSALAPKAIGFSFSQKKSKPFINPLASQTKKAVAPIKMSLGVQKPKAPATIKKPAAVANVFNEEDDSEEEEMPPEAKMRMRNLGRETPTAAGPNSFGKGQLGFCDRHKIIQRELQKKMDEVGPQQ